jgi:hypothetical protein
MTPGEKHLARSSDGTYHPAVKFVLLIGMLSFFADFA